MDNLFKEEERKKKIAEIKTFSVPFSVAKIKENITFNTNSPCKPSKEQIIKQAFKFHSQGNTQEAAKYYQDFIDKGFKDPRVFSNYGNILKENGKLKEAELSQLKAIEIKPDYAKAHSNLGIILKDLGKLHDAELSCRKAIQIEPDYADAYYNLGLILIDLGKFRDAELSYSKATKIKPDFAKAHFSRSLIKYSDKNNKWRYQLFSKNILINKSIKDLVNIYFARANILHKEKQYGESCKYLKLANKLKLNIQPSEPNKLINKSKVLLIEFKKSGIYTREHRSTSESIFIVGMPRSGSTLLESILSMRNDVYDLGEFNILEDSVLEFNTARQEISLAKIYEKKVNNKTALNITTNKYLYNYQYAGIISRHIPNAKSIHCYRNH